MIKYTKQDNAKIYKIIVVYCGIQLINMAAISTSKTNCMILVVNVVKISIDTNKSLYTYDTTMEGAEKLKRLSDYWQWQCTKKART